MKNIRLLVDAAVTLLALPISSKRKNKDYIILKIEKSITQNLILYIQ